MGEERKDDKEPIKVTDRRSFTADGKRRLPEPEEPVRPDPPHAAVKGEGFEMHEPSTPAVDFGSFILSLASSAFVHLGEVPDPVTRKVEVNLEGARQMIDLIDMLRAKTQGNLEPREQELVEGLLYELRLKYADVAARGPRSS